MSGENNAGPGGITSLRRRKYIKLVLGSVVGSTSLSGCFGETDGNQTNNLENESGNKTTGSNGNNRNTSTGTKNGENQSGKRRKGDQEGGSGTENERGGKDTEKNDELNDVELGISPDESLIDEEVDISVLGLSPGERVEIELKTQDSRSQDWRSSAVFEANEKGEIDLTQDKPVSGDYDQTDSMGLFWSRSTHGVRTWFSPKDTYQATLEARKPGSDTGISKSVTRKNRLEGVSLTRINDEIIAKYYQPPRDGPHPGVLVLHGSSGFILEGISEVLASRGYATLALKYFGDEDVLRDELSQIPLEYFEKAIDNLLGRDEVVDDKVSVVGFSRGGEAALLLASKYSQVGVTVGYVPSALVMPGGDNSSSWTYKGEQVPFLPPPDSSGVERDEQGRLIATPLFREMIEQASDDELQEATIPLEDAKSHILTISGEKDRVWPSSELSEIGIKRLEENDYGYDYEHLSYQNSGHNIYYPYTPTTQKIHTRKYVGGGTPKGIAKAQADSWPKVLEYLDKLQN